METPSSWDWAYLTGFFEGEGHVQLLRNRYPKIIIAQKDRTILDELQRRFEGVGFVREFRPAGRNLSHRWTIGKREDVNWLLVGMIPYIIQKKDIVQKALGLPVPVRMR